MTDKLGQLKSALADRYTIQRELGSAGMATVCLARAEKLGRAVALKVLRPEIAASIAAERFLREIDVAAGEPTTAAPDRTAPTPALFSA